MTLIFTILVTMFAPRVAIKSGMEDNAAFIFVRNFGLHGPGLHDHAADYHHHQHRNHTFLYSYVTSEESLVCRTAGEDAGHDDGWLFSKEDEAPAKAAKKRIIKDCEGSNGSGEKAKEQKLQKSSDKVAEHSKSHSKKAEDQKLKTISFQEKCFVQKIK